MDDVISRQAAIDTIEKHLNGVFDGTHYDEGIAYGYEAAHRHIQDLINALQPAQQWIPVSERLPEEQQIVVTYQKWGEYKLNHIIDGTEWYWDGVVAWTPLPEPYREEAENGNN